MSRRQSKRQLRMLYPQAWTEAQRELQAFLDANHVGPNDADLLLTLRAAAVHPDLSDDARQVAASRVPSVEQRLRVHARRQADGVGRWWLAGGWSLVVTS